MWRILKHARMNEFHLLSDYLDVSVLSNSEILEHVKCPSSFDLFRIAMSPNNDSHDEPLAMLLVASAVTIIRKSHSPSLSIVVSRLCRRHT